MQFITDLLTFHYQKDTANILKATHEYSSKICVVHVMLTQEDKERGECGLRKMLQQNPKMPTKTFADKLDISKQT